MRDDNVPVLQRDPEHTVGQYLLYNAIYFDNIFF